MLSWAKGALSAVAGTQEPEYGPDAIQSVAKKAETTPFTLLSKQDQKWQTPYATCVETQTFYVNVDNGGPIVFVQVIYGNIGLTPSVTFNTQVYFLEDKTKNLWSSDTLTNWKISQDKFNLTADKLSITTNEDGSSYHIKSSTNLQSIVDLKFTKTVPGFVVGSDGVTSYGTDPKAPWGSMRHAFWPRCKVEGSILTKTGELKMDGRGMYIHALQGMKPHHCAARWNFVNFQSPSYSAVMMEFTTPPAYASTVVNVSGVTNESDVIFGGGEGTATHTAIKGDPEVNWPEPSSAKYTWKGKTTDGKECTAELEGSLGDRVTRIDVMGEIPAFVKQIASAAAGTRPYIYVYAPKLTLKVKVGDEIKEEEGRAFIEAVFIS